MRIASISKAWWHLGLIAACLVLAAFLSACGGNPDAATSERVLALEAKLHFLEESLEAVQQENAALETELATLREEQVKYDLGQEAAEPAEEREGETDGLDKDTEGQPAAIQEDQAEDQAEDQPHAGERIGDLESRLRELELVAAQVELALPVIQKWFKDMEERVKLLEGDVIEKTARLAGSGGGEAQVINFGAGYGAARSAVLALPDPMPEGEIPLIVSLHGFGGDSFSQSLYVPLHRWVNERGFALLLPNGAVNDDGQQFWNPTDLSFDGKGPQVDDFAALSALVDEAGGEFDRGPVYFFGYSNGGFMSYWMACQGLPGLRAVASLAGTSYIDDDACEGAAPVSVLHIHGTDDAVVRFDGVARESSTADKNEPGYASAQDMARRWASRAGCDGPEPPEPYASLDFDAYVPGAETQAYRYVSGCEEGISIELWASEGSSHGPIYGDAFTGALLDWLLAQE